MTLRATPWSLVWAEQGCWPSCWQAEPMELPAWKPMTSELLALGLLALRRLRSVVRLSGPQPPEQAAFPEAAVPPPLAGPGVRQRATPPPNGKAGTRAGVPN